jgi:putative effector of murein hydrolase
MPPRLGVLWVYLESTPLLGLVSTLVAWQMAEACSRLSRGHPLASPVLLAILLLSALLLLTGTPYAGYFQGAQYIHFLLGPATVALAVPMYSALGSIRRNAHAILPAVLAGAVTAAGSAMLVARALGGSRQVVLSLAPKSVTTPIAMGVAEQIGGKPERPPIRDPRQPQQRRTEHDAQQARQQHEDRGQ